MSTKLTIIAAIVVTGVLLLAACGGGSKKSDDAAPSTTEAKAPEVEDSDVEDEADSDEGEDEGAAFLEHALAEMEMLDISERHYITGATVSGSYLLVTAQLNKGDAATAQNICGALVASSYSTSVSWSTVQIEPLDGGVAAECERRS